jgi:hypothetical protein
VLDGVSRTCSSLLRAAATSEWAIAARGAPATKLAAAAALPHYPRPRANARGRVRCCRRIGRSLELHHHLVDEAPAPVFSRFERSHDRMPCRPKVFRCMLVLRIVAAADMAAGSAEAKMHPSVAGGETLFTARGIGTIRHDEVEMAALGRHERDHPPQRVRASNGFMRSPAPFTPASTRRRQWAVCAGACRLPRRPHW